MSAAFCGFFYSARLFYETLFSKKRSHHSTYATKNCSVLYANYSKRANTVGHVGMLALFAISVFVLYNLILNFNGYGQGFGAANSTNFYPVTSNIQGAVLLVFSLVLFIIAVSFTAFKRHTYRGVFIAIFIAFFALTVSVV